jgi:rubrerythrin
MEEGHIRVLQDLRTRHSYSEGFLDVQDLHISEYLVPPAEKGEKSFQDTLILAMKKEETAFRLYTDLAGKQRGEDARNTFLRLASEEARHKRYLEEMYDDEIFAED